MLNRIIIMGRLTAFPEIKYTTNGTAVCNFTVAVQRDFDKDMTDFIDCVSWRKTAEFIGKYFAKGEMIVVDGRLQTRNWEDKNGTARRTTEIVVDSAYFCGGKKEYTPAKYQDVESETCDERIDDAHLTF